tara:strand:- start:5 stop:268 length:264 start_codon:yes stop_codon:yes gene_type:complete
MLDLIMKAKKIKGETMSDINKMKELTRNFNNLLNKDYYKERMEPKTITSLLEDLEDLVGDYQRDKVSKKQVIETLESIVKYEKKEKI